MYLRVPMGRWRERWERATPPVRGRGVSSPPTTKPRSQRPATAVAKVSDLTSRLSEPSSDTHLRRHHHYHHHYHHQQPASHPPSSAFPYSSRIRTWRSSVSHRVRPRRVQQPPSLPMDAIAASLDVNRDYRGTGARAGAFPRGATFRDAACLTARLHLRYFGSLSRAYRDVPSEMDRGRGGPAGSTRGHNTAIRFNTNDTTRYDAIPCERPPQSRVGTRQEKQTRGSVTRPGANAASNLSGTGILPSTLRAWLSALVWSVRRYSAKLVAESVARPLISAGNSRPTFLEGGYDPWKTQNAPVLQASQEIGRDEEHVHTRLCRRTSAVLALFAYLHPGMTRTSAGRTCCRRRGAAIRQATLRHLIWDRSCLVPGQAPPAPPRRPLPAARSEISPNCSSSSLFDTNLEQHSHVQSSTLGQEAAHTSPVQS
ncbi:hypothetical protein CMUS01_08318 [Colletotrichum musicola]|uniref:Uncharacterized protein n=1 Tax=Colletotrichum musicola TaxID=2175873 RepID=A0A8H6NDX3_9PEZI|nr:hypothetical protein CMUS01_08318 [Colletotrichum musicola]